MSSSYRGSGRPRWLRNNEIPPTSKRSFAEDSIARIAQIERPRRPRHGDVRGERPVTPRGTSGTGPPAPRERACPHRSPGSSRPSHTTRAPAIEGKPPRPVDRGGEGPVAAATSRSRSSIHGRCALATGPRNARVTCRSLHRHPSSVGVAGAERGRRTAAIHRHRIGEADPDEEAEPAVTARRVIGHVRLRSGDRTWGSSLPIEVAANQIQRRLLGPSTHAVAIAGGPVPARVPAIGRIEGEPHRARFGAAVRLRPRGTGERDGDVDCRRAHGHRRPSPARMPQLTTPGPSIVSRETPSTRCFASAVYTTAEPTNAADAPSATVSRAANAPPVSDSAHAMLRPDDAQQAQDRLFQASSAR